MPEATPVAEYDFEIRFRKSGKITVRAAYVQAEQAGAPVVLKSADHKIVFLAPPEVIRSVQRRNPGKRTGPKSEVQVHVTGMSDNLAEAISRNPNSAPKRVR